MYDFESLKTRVGRFIYGSLYQVKKLIDTSCRTKISVKKPQQGIPIALQNRAKYCPRWEMTRSRPRNFNSIICRKQIKNRKKGLPKAISANLDCSCLRRVTSIYSINLKSCFYCGRSCVMSIKLAKIYNNYNNISVIS